MLIITHIVIALSSIVYSAMLYLKPLKFKFYIAYLLVGLTLVTGTVLVIQTHSSLTHSCFAGLIYLAVVLAGIVPAHYKLSSAKSKIKK